MISRLIFIKIILLQKKIFLKFDDADFIAYIYIDTKKIFFLSK
ncbi:hypothetical protein OMAG_001207 [Candidatus Omnitrophus magneticus]|uniref:Uncharacterized protein n=1 Tax=Candidatus Omnitrophus magneticus TaxID=1609969 RepID=A0A0F0CNY3_9BACT|nr:hypothetical protein OMAG_001207 [Candidatus Omnitrophus magneticus]